MKKNIVLASILAISLLATGCSQAGKSSDVTPITLTEREKQIASLVGEYPFVVDVNYPKDVKGTVLSYEVWKNGSMVENNVVMFGGSADESNKESFAMIYDIDDDWKNCKLNLSSTSARTSFDISLLNDKNSAPNAAIPSFAAAEDVDDYYNVKLVPGGSYVLSALTLSYGNSMEAINHGKGDYKDFTSEIDKSNTCVLVRLDTFDSEKAAEKYADSINKTKGQEWLFSCPFNLSIHFSYIINLCQKLRENHHIKNNHRNHTISHKCLCNPSSSSKKINPTEKQHNANLSNSNRYIIRLKLNR